jgi:hypothetical protein
VQFKITEKNLIAGAYLNLIEASLRVHYELDFDAKQIKELLTAARERSKIRG